MWVWCIAGAYMTGSIPFGVIIARSKGIDIFAHGSGNIGATNVGRIMGRRWGALCFTLDVLKGAVAVLAAGIINDTLAHRAVELTRTEMWLWMAVAVAAVIGHMYSIFLRFRGGKGVATGFGGLVFMWNIMTLPALGALVVWYTLLRLTKYVSLASMGAALSLPVWYLLTILPPTGEGIGDTLLHGAPPAIVTFALALMVVWKHRTNIGRLLKGTEPK